MMVKIEVKCPECGGIKVSKNEKTETGVQRYICNNKACSCKSFMLEYVYNGSKHGIEIQSRKYHRKNYERVRENGK